MSRPGGWTGREGVVRAWALLLAVLLAGLAPASEAKASFSVQYSLVGVDDVDKKNFRAYVIRTDSFKETGIDTTNLKITVDWPFLLDHYPAELWTVRRFSDSNGKFRYDGEFVYTSGTNLIKQHEYVCNIFGACWCDDWDDGYDLGDALAGASANIVTGSSGTEYMVSTAVGRCEQEDPLFIDGRTYTVDAYYEKQGKLTQTYSFSTPIPVPTWDDQRIDWIPAGSITRTAPVRKVDTPEKKGWAVVRYELTQNGVTTVGGSNSVSFTLSGDDSLAWFYEPGYDITVALKERAADGSETELDAASRLQANPQPWYGTNFKVGGDASVSVNDPLTMATDGERLKLAGWRGTGNLNNLGTLNPVDFTLTRDSSIAWIYERQDRLRIGFDPAVPASVRAAANPQPPVGDNWQTQGSYQAPYVNSLVSDAEGNRWKCDSWTRVTGGTTTSRTGSSVPGFSLDAPAVLTWGCRQVYQTDVRANGVPGELSGSGFAPAVTVGWVTANASTDFTAPLVIHDYSLDYRYELDEVAPVTIRKGGQNVTPDATLRDEGNNRYTATVTVGGDLTVTWNYRERIRLKVEAGGLSGLSLSDPVECSGDSSGSAVERCVNDANAGVSSATVQASGEHYYQAGTALVATALAQVTDGGDKTCTAGYVYGPAQADGALSGNRRYLKFVMDRPTRIVWDYANATPISVGDALTPPDDWNGGDPAVQLLSPALDAQDPAGKFFFGGLPRRLYFLRPFATVRVTWTNASGVSQPPQYYVVGWPAAPQRHVAGAPVRLMTPTRARTFAGIAYSEGSLGAVDEQGVFTAPLAGSTVLKFVGGLTDDDTLNPVSFAVVRTDAWETLRAAGTTSATVGTPVTNPAHAEPEGRNGYVLFAKAPYLAASPEGHNRAERTGPIIPVNETFATLPDRRMVVAWYQNVNGVGWPVLAVEYAVSWPAAPPTVTISTGLALTAAQAAGRVYHQSDPALAGFNPNEEHALVDGGALYALRDDLNRYGTNDLEWYSRPYVLLVSTSAGQTQVDVFSVARPASFARGSTAGQRLSSPLPPSLSPHASSAATAGVGVYHRDRKGGHWAKGVIGGQQIVMAWYYPMRDDFFFPDYDGDQRPDRAAGDPAPFLSSAAAFGVRQRSDPPLGISYAVSWPAGAPGLNVGETLTEARGGLPGVKNWPSGQVIFDEGLAANAGPLVKLYAPLRALSAALAQLPDDVQTEPQDGLTAFPELPPTLRKRLFYDGMAKRLLCTGATITDGGDSWMLPNLMTFAERDRIQDITHLTDDDATAWKSAVQALYTTSRNPQGLVTALMGSGGNVRNPVTGLPVNAAAFWGDWGINLGLDYVTESDGTVQPTLVSLAGESLALSAGMARGTGYVTLVSGDDQSLGSEPVALYVIRIVSSPVFTGEVRVLASENVFDERLTLRHTGDFGGEPELFDFEWYSQPDPGSVPGLPAGGPAPAPWAFHGAGPGMVETTIEGASAKTLADNYFVSRYYYARAWPKPAISADPSPAGTNAFSTPKDANNWSGWAGAPGGASAQLAMGWTKRVFDSLNLLEARVRDFRRSPTSTVVSMISQLGERYEGDIAFGSDPDFINSLGLIQAYETILRRALALSVNAGIDDPATRAALLNAATRIADFYMLLGNEAYADAVDPTIGLDTGSGAYGSVAPSIFAFQNQVSSLLEEELSLLRGRDNTFTSTRTRPFYNRLIWNFTQGDGELAYAQAYNIGDANGDGVIDAADGRRQYPQGHGDAWGHYLTAMTTWVRLLSHPDFSWTPRAESVLVGGSPILVDYQDERKFAAAAAARARTGAEVVDLTYRNAYVADPAGQWQGYKDTDAGRAWGVDDWSRRAAQGAYFEWAVANALLPAADTIHTGIAKVDRTTVPELGSIAGQFVRIQSQMSSADRGVNPLGLAKGVVAFDIDPTEVDRGKTHFEQVYDRALGALRNTVAVYDYASAFTRGLRDNNESLEDFRRTVDERENDYMNRLIEIFGYPYPEDIGAAYPAGYDGPDWIHYMYVDRSELTGEPIPPVIRHAVNFTFDLGQFDESLGIGQSVMPVEFVLSAGGAYAVKPPEWSGKRRAPGEIQRALSEYILADAALARALKEYEYQLGDIETAKGDLEARHDLLGAKIQVLNEANGSLSDLDGEIRFAQDTLSVLRSIQYGVESTAGAIVDGLGCDNCEVAALWVGLGGAVIGTGLEIASQVQENAIVDNELAKEQVQRNADFKLFVADASTEINDMIYALEVGYNELILKKMEIYTRKEELQQALGQYQAAVAEGQRLLAERSRFRAQTAADVQEYRYDDLSFRVFRNDALQKYRAQFDLAARYVYLAATAYDYETNLLGTSGGSGAGFLADIVRQRSLGQVLGGSPVAGQPGLADPMARMAQNFAIYKSQLGFNNPQTETNRFSLRKELLRQMAGTAGDQDWRSALDASADGSGNSFFVADLWAVPEFKRFCRPFAPASAGGQPGLVIPFATTIAFGQNFFGKPLAAGDSAYDPSNFATKVRKVGVWFEGYDTSRLSLTPRVYLIPVGADVLRSPTGDGFATREWNVVDQKLPVPFTLGASSMNDPQWIPVNDSLSDELGGIRRFSSFRAYPDPGDTAALWQTQMTGDSRLIGRSVWNTRWLLIIPGGTFLADPQEGLASFADTVKDIKLFFQTYAYSGN